MSFTFKALLTEEGWLQNATVHLDSDGKIHSIESSSDSHSEKVNGFAIPGFQNAHSHAFQYAMAGLAEYFETDTNPDNFWSWRDAMYRVALSLSPDQMEDVAAMLYAEMLRNGYTAVAEFHYVHHQKDGSHYRNLSEMGERLVSAAKRVGIKITLIPMFYQKGNFGTEPSESQRRFISKNFDEYLQLLEASKRSVSYYNKANLAVGAHSLRAVRKEDVIETAKLSTHYPFHIHIAEQLKEIADCEHFYGNRPAEWLLENTDVNHHFNLIHCTHLNDFEVENIAKSGANIVLCPSTEGNLGDGRFRFSEYQKFNGNWSIGTDSQICINPLEDLRVLDYGQRIHTHRRDTFFKEQSGDSGCNALKMIWKSGRQSMGVQNESFFKVGDDFDAVIFDAKAPLLASSSLKHLCNTIVYASHQNEILGTIVSGNWVVKNGQHFKGEELASKFISTLNDLKIRRL